MIIYACLTACASNIPISSEPIGQTHFVEIKTEKGPVKMFVRDEGHGDPILLLHGFGANIFTWRYLFADLKENHRVIAVDMKGFGKSDKPYDQEYSAFDQAKLISKLIKKLKLKNLTLLGHSYGGGVAFATFFKLRGEENKAIKNLIILDGLAYKQPIPFFLKVIRMPFISHYGMAIVPPEVHTRASLAYSYQNKKRITDEAVSNYATPYYSLDSIYAARQTARQIIPKDIDTYTKLYPTIKIPTLLIWCRHDRVVPLINGFKLNSTLPNSKLEIIGDCGHIPHEEAPTETANAILDFLKKQN